MKKYILHVLVSAFALISTFAEAQSSCSNPTVVSCGTTLTNESTIGQGDNMDYDGTCVSLNPNNGEDMVYAITPAAGVTEITITLDNVNVTPGFPTANYFETYIANAADCNTSCFQHTQFTENGLVNGGTSNTAIFSLGAAANGSTTYYIVIDEQLSGGALQNYDITFDCISGGVHLDTDGCSGDAGLSSTDGHNDSWNGSLSDVVLINSCGESGTFCTEFWIENPGWEWVDQIEMTLGPCWDGNSISNATPTSGSWYEGGNWGVSIDNASSTILWDFTSSGGSGTWGDGNSNNQNCVNYTFCFDATVLPSCSDVNDLNFTITVTDDGIGGSGATVATFFNYNTSFALAPGPTITGIVPVCEGESITLSGSGTPNATTPWSSSDPTVATITNGGVVTGVSSGVTTITYTDNTGCQVQELFGVNPSPTISGNAPVCVGSTVQLTGSGTPDGATPWASSNPGVATVNGTGLITGVAQGTSTITYLNDVGCSQTVIVTVNPQEDATFSLTPTCDGGTATISGTSGGTFAFNTTPGDAAVIDPATGAITNGTSGTTYDVVYTTSGVCFASSTQQVTALVQDDASFSMTPSCDGGVAVISGTTGGTFSFNTAPTDAAVIDPSTGVVSGGTSGNTYDILYTTSGVCPDNSTQQVTATNADDPSFNMTATCDGGTAAVTGTAGGTFSFVVAPTDGAVIDPSTGTVSGGTPGGTYDIQYTTAGACSQSSTQQVTALIQDDPSFTMTATCDGGTAAVTGTAGGTFSFNVAPGDAAVIDAASGTVSGGTSGATYDVLYTTSGVCPSTLVQQVTALPQDDATFTMTPTCDGGIASVSGTAGGTFSFTTAPSDGANLDASTGVVTGGTPGASYEITYTTSGACPSSNDVQFSAYPLPPAPVAGNDTTYCVTWQFNPMNASGVGGTFNWYLDVTSSPIGTGPNYTPENVVGTTTYYVTETVNGCEGPSSSVTINVQGCDITIPTAFTPNGDQNNDSWEIVDLDITYPDNSVKVFNRWGNLVFEHNSKNGSPYKDNQWDGTYEGDLLPVGSYYYVIEFNDPEGGVATGAVSIVLK